MDRCTQRLKTQMKRQTNEHLILVVFCSLALLPFQRTDAQEAPDPKEKLQAVSRTMQGIMSIHDIPSASAIVLVDGTTHVVNFGKQTRGGKTNVDQKSIYQIASLSKTFVGIVTHELMKIGVLKVDDSITKHLPNDLNEETKKKLSKITVAHLLHHRSGLPRSSPQRTKDKTGSVNITYTDANLLQDLNQIKLPFEPGTKVAYSNFGYALLAHLCERAAGKPYAELLKEYVTQKYSMPNTGLSITSAQQEFLVTPYNDDDRNMATTPWSMGKLAPPSAVYSTTEDLARLMKIQLKDYQAFEANSVVSPLVLTNNKREMGNNSELSYGYGFYDSGNGKLGHGGGMDGYGSEYVIAPSSNTGFVMLTSSCGPWSIRLADGVMKILAGTQEDIASEVIAVEKIIVEFRTKGLDAAFQVYQKLRSAKPSPLGVDSRISLVNLANQFRLDDAAKLFLGDALEDFPKSKKLKSLKEQLEGQ